VGLEDEEGREDEALLLLLLLLEVADDDEVVLVVVEVNPRRFPVEAAVAAVKAHSTGPNSFWSNWGGGGGGCGVVASLESNFD
jgi:hypothetical protein